MIETGTPRRPTRQVGSVLGRAGVTARLGIRAKSLKGRLTGQLRPTSPVLLFSCRGTSSQGLAPRGKEG